MIFLSSPNENELYPLVIFFNPNLDKKFSKGKNSPKGTRFILLYTYKISSLLFTITRLLKYFLSFKHINIYRLLRIKSSLSVGLSFAYNSSVKTIIQKSKNPKIKFLILDKTFLNKKKIQELKINKFFYTIKKKRDFKKYHEDNNLIFENL